MKVKLPSPEVVRPYGLPLALGGAALAVMVVASQHYPVWHWLVWRYLLYATFALIWAVACLSVGYTLVRRWLPGRLRIGERVAVAFALGVLAFSWLMFLGGMCHLLSSTFALLLPLVMLGFGGRRSLRILSRAAMRLGGLGWRWSWLAQAALLFGVLGILAVYLPILTPDNLSYDARWYHLPLAERYATVGAITRHDEGWVYGTYPQLASLVYTWAFLLPHATLFDHVEICAHLEFVTFIITLAGIPSLAYRLVRHIRMPLAWVAVFLFPGILVYDGTLSGGADHFAALWAVPIGLLAMRELDRPAGFVLGAVVAGAALTKYSAICLVVPALLVVARAAFCRCAGGAATCMAAMVLLTAPHWLKNVLWYGDPLFPVLHRFLTPRPWTPQAAHQYETIFRKLAIGPSRDLRGLLDTLRAALTVGFEAHKAGPRSGPLPVFGFLFPLCLIAMPFLRAGARLWRWVGLTLLGLVAWYSAFPLDRYLQACLPWLVAIVTSAIALVWRLEALRYRVGLAVLVATQVVWGLDAFFLPAHATAIGSHPLQAVLGIVAAGQEGRYADRFKFNDPWPTLGRALPPRSKVLVHDRHGWLGIGAAVLSDEVPWQGGINYGSLDDRQGVHKLLKELGATHLVTAEQSSGLDSLASDLVFWDYVRSSAVHQAKFAAFDLWRVADQVGPARHQRRVLMLTCQSPIMSGVYELSDLNSVTYGQPEPQQPRAPVPAWRDWRVPATSDIGYVVSETACILPVLSLLQPELVKLVDRVKFRLWSRAPRP